jgi:hypothetical protein
MAMTNRNRIGQGLEHLASGLSPFVDSCMTAAVPEGQHWLEMLAVRDRSRFGSTRRYSLTDPRLLLRVMTEERRVFKDHLSWTNQSFASELRETGNRWAHGEDFSHSDTYRALDTMERLLSAVGAAEHAVQVRKLRRGIPLAEGEVATGPPAAPSPQPADAPASETADAPGRQVPGVAVQSTVMAACVPETSSPRSVASAAHKYLSPREALRNVDPQRAMLVVTCSTHKRLGGKPPGPDRETPWPRELRDARACVRAASKLDATGVMPAWHRYTGTFYQHALPALEDAVERGRVLIISGGYGILRADELIGWYDRQLDLADWPRGVLESALISETHRRGADTVVAFAPGTTRYAQLLRRTPWRQTGITAWLVTVSEVADEAMIEVPRRLSGAFSALWSKQPDEYPPGIVVEDLG